MQDICAKFINPRMNKKSKKFEPKTYENMGDPQINFLAPSPLSSNVATGKWKKMCKISFFIPIIYQFSCQSSLSAEINQLIKKKEGTPEWSEKKVFLALSRKITFIYALPKREIN